MSGATITPRQHFDDEILALVASGLSLKSACDSDHRFPTPGTWGARMRRDHVLSSRYEAATARRLSPHEAFFVADFDPLLRLVSSGMTLTAAVASDPRFPVLTTLLTYVRRDPDKRRQLDDALRQGQLELIAKGHGRKHRRYSEREYQLGLEALRASEANDLHSVFVAPLPSYYAMWSRCQRDPTFSRAFAKALDARREMKARLFVEAVRLLDQNPYETARAVFEAASTPLPPLKYFQWKAKNHPELSKLAAPVKLKRKRMQAFRRQTERAKPVYAENQLAISLRQNEYYKIAQRALPRMIDASHREDIVSEMICEMLAGTLSTQDALQQGKQFAAAYSGGSDRFRYSSLDEDLPGGFQGETWVSTITTDQWIPA